MGNWSKRFNIDKVRWPFVCLCAYGGGVGALLGSRGHDRICSVNTSEDIIILIVAVMTSMISAAVQSTQIWWLCSGRLHAPPKDS
jgi:hypothetical protein